MKKVLAITMVIGMVASVAQAIDYASSYIFRGFTVHEGAAIQAGMDTEISGLEVGAWASYDVDAQDFGEVDFAIGMPLTSVGGVDLDVGLCQYIYTGGENDTEFALNAGTAIAGLDVAASMYVTTDGVMSDYNIVGVSKSFDLTPEISASVGYEYAEIEIDDDFGEAYSSVSISAETALSDDLGLGVTYVSLSDGDAGYNQVNDQDDFFIVSVSGDLF